VSYHTTFKQSVNRRDEEAAARRWMRPMRRSVAQGAQLTQRSGRWRTPMSRN